MPIINPFPLPNYVWGPTFSVQPFTYKDGASYLQILERLRGYTTKVLVPAIETELGNFEDNVENNIALLTNHVNNAISAIINNSVELQDAVAAGLINSASLTKAALDAAYAKKSDFTSLENDLDDQISALSTSVETKITNFKSEVNTKFEEFETTPPPAYAKNFDGGNAGEVLTRIGSDPSNFDWRIPSRPNQRTVLAKPVLSLNVNEWYADAGTQLVIPTYQNPVDGEVTHPSIAYMEGGWNGYTYWMGVTPYPAGNSEYENPSLVASNDGVNWVIPSGLVNPLDDPGADPSYNSDIDIMFGPDDRLYVFWRYFDPALNTETIYVISSDDAVTWTTKKIIHSTLATTRRLVSPSFIYERNGLTMYAVDIANPSDRKLVMLRANNSNIESITSGDWTVPIICTMTALPAGKQVWHVSVKLVNGNYVALINDSNTGANGVNGRLYLASSTNGASFTVATHDLVPQTSPGRYGQVYRATFLPEYRDSVLGFRVIYAAYLTGPPQVWHIYSTFAYTSQAPYAATANSAFAFPVAWTNISANSIVKRSGFCVARFNAIVTAAKSANTDLLTIPVGFRTALSNVWGYAWKGNGSTFVPVYYDINSHTIKSTQALAASDSIAFTLVWDVAL